MRELQVSFRVTNSISRNDISYKNLLDTGSPICVEINTPRLYMVVRLTFFYFLAAIKPILPYLTKVSRNSRCTSLIHFSPKQVW